MSAPAGALPQAVGAKPRYSIGRVAGLAVLLGLAMEALSLLAAAVFGMMPPPRAIVADLAQRVSWSLLVCVGLTTGAAASGGRARVAGMWGLIAAPIAFVLARAAYKGVAEMLSLPSVASARPAPFTLAFLRALQYGILGGMLAVLTRRHGMSWRVHAGAGTLVGLIFGGVALALAVPLPLSALAVRAVNEFLFPIGCTLVAFAIEAFATQRRVQDTT